MRYKKYFILVMAFFLGYVRAVSQINWGYSDNTVVSGIGIGEETVMSGAIYIPDEVAKLYKGKEITALRIGLRSSVKDLSIFVTKDLGSTPVVETSLGEYNSGLASHSFDEHYIIDGNGFYIGYTCTGFNAIGCSSIFHSNGCWIKNGDSEWENYAEDKKYNALNISMRIEGADMPMDARIMNTETVTVKQNEPIKISCRLENLSTTAIKKFQIEYSIDGNEAKTVDKTAYIGVNSNTKFTIDLPGYPSNGIHTVTVTLVSVNGEQDAYSGNNTVVAQIKVTDLFFKKRMVVEEGTGTWCGYCPQGIVAFEEMDKKYPDSFIGIAVHYNDQMSEETYKAVHSYFGGYPSCIVNRNPSMITDVSIDILENIYNKISLEYAEAEVEANSYLDPADDDYVLAEANIRFAFDKSNADYRVAFVVLEDSVTGYAQRNYFSGGSEEMGGFEDLPSSAYIPFNHVARGIYDFLGINGSLPLEVSEGVIYTYQKQLKLENIQRKSHLYVVALLIDGKTGIIENADKCKVALEPTGISEELSSELYFYVDNGSVACSCENAILNVYNMSGVRISNNNLNPGFYIVQCELDGKIIIKKVLV